ncbi:RES family NAD+ phosphorylase [Streptomyces sp. NBC_01408]|uniref:RES family NAD+ phosphorylase n=1 Tax=Streptomyces sp. NBC_01408 TaxID=2903855 RepID=UPI002259E617|nr:RES family NAD+ phosphorylase [Streptomyces sp. NBC_01408]MCX4694867.1 RES family NAD+ phosphorylase [Streptomyces sp. NBC_01408]
MTSPEGLSPPDAVCMNHIDDAHLRRHLSTLMTASRCSFCTTSSARGEPVAVDLRLLVHRVLAGVREKYEPTGAPGQGVSTARAVEDVCRGAVEPRVARAVRDRTEPASWQLREAPRPHGPDPVHAPWARFRRQVGHQRRFTLLAGPGRHGAPSPVPMLDAVSAVVDRLGLVRRLPAGHPVWRGRMRGDTTAPGYVAATIGSTPPARATANRMSPAGVSMFYGSADVATVLAEISAHDPRPYAAVAAFELIRPVSVVDLAAVPGVPSVFDPDRRSLLGPVAFIRSFSEDLSRPVVRDGREHLAYVPTQVLTEYFRCLSPLSVDGIAFRSAHNGGINYVLFTGPEGCVDPGDETPHAMLRLRPGTERVVER